MNKRLIIIFILSLGLLLFPGLVLAAKTSDVNGDGIVNATDVKQILSGWLSTLGNALDIDGNNKVNALDLSYVFRDFGKILPSPTPGASPTIPPTSPAEWTQFGHDAQHSGYTTQVVNTPWRFKWQWNGSDASGKPQGGHLSVPRMVQPITGGGRIYYIAANGVYAFDKNGTILWNNTSLGTLNSTPVYDSGNLYVAGGSNIYKLNASLGNVVASWSAGGTLSQSPAFISGILYAVDDSGNLSAVNTSTMSQTWRYTAGSAAATSPSVSAAKQIAVFVTQDLNVHAVNISNGSRKWMVKPTVRQAGNPGSSNTNLAEAANGWPVIAENHGLVFVRYRLDWDSLWASNPFPSSNSSIRSFLTQNASQQALFALSLDNGNTAFIPAAGNGGAGDGGNLPMGTQPVIRIVSGQEVAYVIWRNSLTCGGCSAGGDCNGQWCDGREDATLGEMVLDNSTVSGYQAGDLRFIGDGQYRVGQTDIQTDEMKQITMSGDTIFHGHWLLSQVNVMSTNRSSSVGSTFLNPIRTTPGYDVIWRQASSQGCTFNSSTRYCSSLYSYNDNRSYDKGFWAYWDASSGGGSPFTVVSDGLILVKTGDGGLMVLESGNPTAGVNQSQPLTQNPDEKVDVLGEQSLVSIDYTQASAYLNRTVTVTGTITSTVNHLPKAIYLGFTDPHDGALLIRIFQKDLAKFDYDPMTLLNKKIKVTGKVTLYWPENIDPEIIVTDPSQITSVY